MGDYRKPADFRTLILRPQIAKNSMVMLRFLAMPSREDETKAATTAGAQITHWALITCVSMGIFSTLLLINSCARAVGLDMRLRTQHG